MPIVSQNARLSKWKPEYSSLDIDATPERYDTTGKLGSLPAGASQLNFDGALPAPADNFINTNANGFTLRAPYQVTQFKSNGQTSQLGFPAGPTAVNYFANTNAKGFTLKAQTGVTDFVSNGQTSQYGIPGGPTPVNYFANTNANGFTLNAPYQVTQFVGNGQTSQYGIPGGPTPVNYFANTNANGFTLRMPYQVTDFISNGQTSQYGFPGALPSPVNYFANTNSSGFKLQAQVGVSDFVGNGQTSLYGFAAALPSPIDFFLNTNSKGFTLQMPYQVSDFISNGQTSQYGFAAALPSPTDFFLNANSKGFTLQMPYQVSDFIANGQTSQFGFAAALPSPVNYFTNTNANGFTLQMPYQVSDFISNGQTSQYGFASALPAPVDFFLNTKANGFTLNAPYQTTQFIDPGNSSQFGFAGALPAPVDMFFNIYANGFTLNAPYQVTQFLDPGNQSIYGFAGALPSPVDMFTNDHSKGFTLQMPYQVTDFIGNGQTSAYGFPSALPAPTNFFLNTNANGFTLNAPYQVTQFVGDGQTSLYGFAAALPSPVNYFANTNANGFTLQMPYQVTDFIANGQTSQFGFAATLPRPVNFFRNINAVGFTLNAPYQVTKFIADGQTSQYGFASTLPAPVNYFANTNANGFTLNAPYQVTQFVGNGQTSQYGFAAPLPRPVNFFRNINAVGFTLNAPYQVTKFVGNGQTSLYGFASTLPNPVNYFIDPLFGAKGFTLRQAALDTQFIGAAGASYSYPSSVYGGRLMSVGQGPWVGGIAKLENQLGAGSPKFGNKGWSTANRYAPGGTWTSLNSPGNLQVYSITRRSPSPLDNAYSYSTYYGHNLKLRATAYNPSYINHPLILRGIQDGVEPQRWGTGTALDGGGIRGGIVTAAERSAIDVARIGKILASPQGIIWSIAQLGLAKSNPISEVPNARLRIGPVVLGSVATNAFGIHLKSNNLGPEYEEIVKAKHLGTGPGPSFGPNRLVTLASSLFPVGFVGQPIPLISGPGGPQSVYGIGATTIRRATDTRSDFTDPFTIKLINRAGWPVSGIINYYAGLMKPTTGHLGDTKAGDLFQQNGELPKILAAREADNPGTFNGDANFGKIDTRNIAEPTDQSAKSGVRHSTLPYTEIANLASSRRPRGREQKINDFRSGISNSNTFSTSAGNAKFESNNLTTKYGFGSHGDNNRDRSNPDVSMQTAFGNRTSLASNGNYQGDRINAIDYLPSVTDTNIYPGVNDFIKFYFGGADIGESADDVVPFRATVRDISDNFNPSWSPVSVMGRPDSPAIYSSFDRSVDFSFTVVATTREELIPMWRKLNYLATFTMPLYSSKRPAGTISRLTIGNMYHNVPGYITSLGYNVNEEATWDLAADETVYAKQLPNIVDVSCTFQVIHDYRPQKGGRAYSLYNTNTAPKGAAGNWLPDAKF